MVRLELNFEVAPDFLLKPVQVEDEVPLVFWVSIVVHDFDLLPDLDLVDQRVLAFVLDLVVLQSPDPARIGEDRLNRVFLHVGDDQVQLGEGRGEGPEADRVEVHDLVAHILEHPIEGQVVVLAQTELKEGHVLLLRLRLVPQLVVQEAAEELGVALLGVDGQRFLVDCTLRVVVSDGLRVRAEHAEEDEERADHHACAPLASLAMHNNHRLLRQVCVVPLERKLAL